MKRRILTACIALSLFVPTFTFAMQNNTINTQVDALNNQSVSTEYVEQKSYNSKNNKSILSTVPKGIKLEDGAKLENLTISKKYVKIDENGNCLFVTVEEAKKLKKEKNVTSLESLVDNNKAKEKIKNKLKQEKGMTSKKSNVRTSSYYDHGTNSLYSITGHLYTYTLSAKNGFNSRAQLVATFLGLSLLPNGYDNQEDLISMIWATDGIMTHDGKPYGAVTYTNYSPNPDQTYTVNISGNKNRTEVDGIALQFNDRYNTYYVPTSAVLNVIVEKTNKVNDVAYAMAELGHTYTNLAVDVLGFSVSYGGPTFYIEYSYQSGVKKVPVSARFWH
ncbi:MAG TPA: hypothetical protein DDY49_03975 [Paenibacillaceae bacterium]|nr:hypothetical protein [Paenibacillaceae bacterium]